jgi:hypothetical protein
MGACVNLFRRLVLEIRAHLPRFDRPPGKTRWRAICLDELFKKIRTIACGATTGVGALLDPAKVRPEAQSWSPHALVTASRTKHRLHASA